jgi:SAM-dependent methyltransferase
MTGIQDYYQGYWSSDGFSPTGHNADWKLTELFEAVVTPARDSLDVGCGDGSKSGPWLAAHARSYVGVDVSPQVVDLACARGLDARVVPDAAELPFPDASFDVVVISEVLEHLFDPLGATREARRVLREQGDLVVTVPNIAHWRNRADLALLGRWHPGGDNRSVEEPWRDPHLRFFTPQSMRSLLVAAGFQPVAVGGYVPFGSVLGRLPGVRRLTRDDVVPGALARALVDAAPSALGTRVFAHARLPHGGRAVAQEAASPAAVTER